MASFEADVELDGEEEPLKGVFIRAPRVTDIGGGVEVIGRLEGEPVATREAVCSRPRSTPNSRTTRGF